MNIFKKKNAYENVINEIFDSGSVSLTNQQYYFLKRIYLKDGFKIGLHNTYISANTIFENGLYNQNSMGKDSNDLTNTVFLTSHFINLLPYHDKNNTTILLLIPEDVINEKQGLFEYLKNGIWGIPTEFIIGAFEGENLVLNDKYNPLYNNLESTKIEKLPYTKTLSKEEKSFETDYCEMLFLRQLNKRGR